MHCKAENVISNISEILEMHIVLYNFDHKKYSPNSNILWPLKHQSFTFPNSFWIISEKYTDVAHFP